MFLAFDTTIYIPFHGFSGNYNFFNFLYLALCLSLLDDGDFRKSIGLKPVSNCFGSSRFQRRGFTLATSLATFAALAYLTMKSFYLPARGTKVWPRFLLIAITLTFKTHYNGSSL